MSLECVEFQTLLEFGPLLWNLGDNLVVFPSSIEGVVTRTFSCVFGQGSFNGCLHCSLASTIMPPCQRMVRRRGGVSNVGVKCYFPFTFNSVTTFFDFVSHKLSKEILVLESKELRDRPYRWTPCYA